MLSVLPILAGVALTASSALAQDPPGSARLAHLQGNVSFQPNGQDGWGQASSNMPLGPGDRIFTDGQAEGEMQAQSVRAYFSPGTDLTLTNMNAQGVELGIASGSILVYCDGFLPGQSLFVSTPNGGVTLAGSGNFRIDVYPDQQSAVVTNLRGYPIQLNGAGGFAAQLDGNGQALQLSGANPVFSQPVQPALDDPFGHWAGNLDAHRFNSISARYVSAEMHGYDDLDNNGDWQPQSEYGPIWYPRVAVGWAPYHNGHWVHMPFYGWTWVADEPWGAAPFHYGRWVVVSGRWGWIPGPREAHPVWSPAQVVFAGGVQVGGAGVSVWFPLGPGEPYHPWYPCTPEYVNRINITNIRETTVVHTVVNYNVVNVTNITYVNRTVGVTAMRQEDFASGHPAQATQIHVNPQQIEHIQPAPPAAQPPATRIILRPVAKPTAAPLARPVLINHQGQQAPAAPNAKPVAVPVKQVVAPQPIPGHAAVGTPSVGGKPAPQLAPKPAPVPSHQAAQPPATQIAPQITAKPAPTAPAPTRPQPPAPIQTRPQSQTEPAPSHPQTPPPAQVHPQPPPPPTAKPVEPKPAPPVKDPKKDNKKPEDKKKDEKKPE
jgi:hypothetical protein